MPFHLALSMRPLPPLEVLRQLAPESDPAVAFASVDGANPELFPSIYAYSTDSDAVKQHVYAALSHLDRVRWRGGASRPGGGKAQARAAQQQEEARRAAEQQRQQQEAARRAAVLRQQQQAEAEQRRRQEEAARLLLQSREDQMNALVKAAAMGSVVRIRETWRQLAPLSPQEASRVMLDALQHSGSLAAVREIDSLWDRAVHKDWANLAVSDSSGRTRHLIFSLVDSPERMEALHRDHPRQAGLAVILEELLRRQPALARKRDTNGFTALATAVEAGAPIEVLRVLARPGVVGLTFGHPPMNAVELAFSISQQQYSPMWARHYMHAAHYLDTVLWEEQQRKEDEERRRAKAAQEEELRRAKAAQEERRRRCEALRAATDGLAQAVEAGDVPQARQALGKLMDPQIQDIVHEVLPQEGLPAFLESLVLKAPDLATASMVAEVGQPHGVKPVANPAMSAPLLEAALRTGRWQLARELIEQHADAVAHTEHPPVWLALRHAAPAELLTPLAVVCPERRKGFGGANAAPRDALPPAALAAEQGKVAVLSQLLEFNPPLEFVAPALEDTQQQPQQQRRRKGRANEAPPAQPIPPSPSTLLYHACATGQEQAAAMLQQHARRRLAEPARLAAHVNKLCGPGGGVTALYRSVHGQAGGSLLLCWHPSTASTTWHMCHPGSAATSCMQHAHLLGRRIAPSKQCNALPNGLSAKLRRAMEKLPGSRLVDGLLQAGADPGIACHVGKQESTAIHLAAHHRDFKLAQRLLKGLSPDQRQRVVRQAGAGGQTLLHLAVEGQDLKLVQLLVGEKAPLLASPVSASPLLAALRHAEAATAAAEAAAGPASPLGAAEQATEATVKGATEPPTAVSAAAPEAAKTQQAAAAAAAQLAGQVCQELLKAWKPDCLLPLLEAELAEADRALVAAFVQRHAATVLAPFLQAKGTKFVTW
ncbi:hypothetical protein ABPG77_002580 [Micractinium sp. CCAP 211/92]